MQILLNVKKKNLTHEMPGKLHRGTCGYNETVISKVIELYSIISKFLACNNFESNVQFSL